MVAVAADNRARDCPQGHSRGGLAAVDILVVDSNSGSYTSSNSSSGLLSVDAHIA